MQYPYIIGVVGGSFDHFHRGHVQLLETTFQQCQFVYLGIATEKLTKHKNFQSSFESYTVREENIKSYLFSKKYIERTKIVPIDDVYGNTITEKAIEAIFVTDDTKAIVPKINEQRILHNMPPLKMVTVPFVNAEDGIPISSERIRKGEIDRSGLVYYQQLLLKKKYILPDNVRNKLREPFGSVVQNVMNLFISQQYALIIAVGDMVVLKLHNYKKQPDISIVDLKNRRAALQKSDISLLKILSPQYTAINPPGSLDCNGITAIKESLAAFLSSHQKQTILISGEEDLLVIPAIVFAPLNTLVIYGQYNLGAVGVLVTESKKKEMLQLLSQFS